MLNILVTLLGVCLTVVQSNVLASLEFPEYCLYYGYPTETHLIKTEDNYTLKFFRVQGKFGITQQRTAQSETGTE